jgi:N4-gp56 family major capsid protein
MALPSGAGQYATGVSAFGANVLPDVFVEKRFVDFLRDKLVAVPLGVPSTLPEYNGKVVRWQFFTTPSAKTTAITTEGGDPSAAGYTTTTAQATLEEFGSFGDYAKMLQKTAISGTMEEIARVHGYEAGLSLDSLAIAVADGSTTTVDAGTSMTAEFVRQAAAKLAINNAEFHRATGGTAYCGVLSAEQCYDMMGEGAPAWFQVKRDEYVRSLVRPFNGSPESTDIYNVVVKMSNNVQQVSSEDLGIVVGDESFGVASLDTNALQPRLIIIRPEENVSAPLKNRGSVGWWALFKAVILDVRRVVQLKSDVS